MIKGEEDLKSPNCEAVKRSLRKDVSGKRDQENGKKRLRSNKQPLKTALKVKVDLQGNTFLDKISVRYHFLPKNYSLTCFC